MISVAAEMPSRWVSSSGSDRGRKSPPGRGSGARGSEREPDEEIATGWGMTASTLAWTHSVGSGIPRQSQTSCCVDGRVCRHDLGPSQADVHEAGGHTAELAGSGPPAEPGALHDGRVPGRLRRSSTTLTRAR